MKGTVLCEDGGNGRCKTCGSITSDVRKTCPTLVTKRERGNRAVSLPLELGDITEIAIAKVIRKFGVTDPPQEWYVAIKNEYGFDPNCSCPERKEWLNNVSRWIRSKLGRV